ncbi:dihydropteroate synthase [Mesonia sp. K7]|uniref:dihydropteroate synthase n=1 Tax=Mesonia sp. K7 TaxID=2218606 RepID=UPI000DA7F4CB|nr:dihydropteroate synthase [Mesonia sp. K7]PZD78116.1 dihydropteroate synthase [Mesonia sp. K7]
MEINCKGKLICLDSPQIMGILNLTPDSFYDGGKYKSDKEILTQTEKMLTEGAFCVDVGAYSSRPGADDISTEEELSRILPIVELLLKKFPEILLSIDTFRSKVAQKCVETGAAIVNDISGGCLDENMLETVGKLQVPFVMMHMQGNPQNMKDNNHYENLIQDIIYYFSQQVAKARQHQINDIIIDPGFGFSKNIQQNFELLNHLESFKILDLPLLAGLSRKSMIYKTLKTTPENALNGTTALNAIALYNKANILRVHDVKEAKECVRLMQNIIN